MKKGTFYGIGVGPGDSELMTVKAARLLNDLNVIFAPEGSRGVDVALEIALGAIKNQEEKRIIKLSFPMTKDKKETKKAYAAAADSVAEILKTGEDCALITLGDPSVYSTCASVLAVIKEMGYEAVLVPGVSSFCASAAALNIDLVKNDEPLHIYPASFDIKKSDLSLSGTKVIMKSGRFLSDVIKKLDGNNKVYMAEKCTMADQRLFYSVDEIPENASYFSTVIIKDGAR